MAQVVSARPFAVDDFPNAESLSNRLVFFAVIVSVCTSPDFVVRRTAPSRRPEQIGPLYMALRLLIGSSWNSQTTRKATFTNRCARKSRGEALRPQTAASHRSRTVRNSVRPGHRTYWRLFPTPFRRVGPLREAAGGSGFDHCSGAEGVFQVESNWIIHRKGLELLRPGGRTSGGVRTFARSRRIEC